MWSKTSVGSSPTAAGSGHHRAGNRAGRRLNTAAAILILLIGATCLVFLTFTDFGRGFDVDYLLVLAAVVFTVVGALILHRADGNRVGWVMAAAGLALFAGGVADVLAEDLLVGGGQWVDAISGALWLSWLVLVGLLMYLFPTGRAVTPRWRWLGWLGMVLAAMSLSYVVSDQLCLEDGSGGCLTWVDNPIGIDGVPNPEYGEFSAIGLAGLVGFTLLAAASLVVRFVRSRGVERLQLKWFAAAVVGLIGATIVDSLLAERAAVPAFLGNLLWSLAIVALPVAIGASILRYRLYEIDRIVSRTVTYLLVVGLLAAAYAGAFILVTRLLPTQSDLGVAAATLGVAALFNPVRRRIQTMVDRRFNRSRYNTQKVMDDFSASLQDRIDSASLVDGWLGVVGETMQPARISVWIR